jgi:hypothetical protein
MTFLHTLGMKCMRLFDEAVKGASRHDTEMRKAASKERKSGIKNRLSPAAGKDNADKMQRDVNYFDRLTKKNRMLLDWYKRRS